MDKDGKPLTSERDQAARWVQHFKDVLNRPEPKLQANIQSPCKILDIDTGSPTRMGVEKAIRAMKSSKAAGMLKC